MTVFSGLPSHVLFVHFLVVLVPLTAVLEMACALWPAVRRGQIVWATLILAYDVGAVANTFSYPLFIGQGGMEFWLLNAALFGAAAYQARAARRPAPRPARAPAPAGAA